MARHVRGPPYASRNTDYAAWQRRKSFKEAARELRVDIALRKPNRVPHRAEQPEVAGPKIRPKVDGPETSIAVGVRCVEELYERHFALVVAGLRDAEQAARAP